MHNQPEKFFVVKFVFRLKSDSSTTKDVYIAQDYYAADELYSGSPEIYGLLDSINGFGMKMGEVIGESASGNIFIKNVRHSFGAGKRLSDLLDAYNLSQQDVCVYAVQKGKRLKTLRIEDLGWSGWYIGDAGATVDSAQRVSAWADQSGNSRNAAQSTDGYKPVLSRADNLENILLQSASLSTSPWGATNCGYASQTITATSGVCYLAQGTVTHIKDVPMRFSLLCKNVSTRYCVARFYDGATSKVFQYDFTTGNARANEGVTATATDAGDGWIRLTGVWTPGATAVASGNVLIAPSKADLAFGGNSVGDAVMVKEPHFCRASSSTTYVATTVDRQWAGINGHRTLVFDGVDDVLARTDFIGTGAQTVFVVSQPYSFGGANAGRILDNGKTIHSLNSTNSLVDFTSDGSTTAKTANDSVTLNSVAVHAVTRTAAGAANHYINGLLSGTADQASGTPEAATTALCLGNRAARDRGSHGQIAEVLIAPRGFSPYEIEFVSNYLLSKYAA